MLIFALESVPVQSLLPVDRKETRQTPRRSLYNAYLPSGRRRCPTHTWDKVSPSSRLVSHSMTFRHPLVFRTNSAFNPWVPSPTDAFLRWFHPPSYLLSLLAKDSPMPRLILLSVTSEELPDEPHPLFCDQRYDTSENERITADDDWIRIFGMLNYGVRHPICHHVVGVFKRDGSMVLVMTTMGWLI